VWFALRVFRRVAPALVYRPNKTSLSQNPSLTSQKVSGTFSRIERRVPIEAHRIYPVYIGGRWGGPPEDSGGGPAAFLEQRDAAPWRVQELLGAVADTVVAKDVEASRKRRRGCLLGADSLAADRSLTSRNARAYKEVRSSPERLQGGATQFGVVGR